MVEKEKNITKYEMITVPNPVLKQTAKPVENIDESIITQIERMKLTMQGCAIGLAANQVGILNRVLVMDVEPDSWEYGEEKDGILPIFSSVRENREENTPPSNAIAIINPEITWRSEQKSSYLEGCTSVPKQFAEIIRPAGVKVKYIDISGKEQEKLFEGLESHCIQHEIDHLNGKLFIDYLSSLKRNMMIRKVQKAQKGIKTL